MKKLSVLFLSLMAVMFSSCSVIVGLDDLDELVYAFAHSERYAYGDCSCVNYDAETLNIDWYYGSVIVERTSKNCVAVYERSESSISNECRLRHYYSGSNRCFFVKYCSPTSKKKNLQNRKTLIVQIPYSSNVTTINVHNKNGDITINMADESGYQVNTNGCNCCCHASCVSGSGSSYECGNRDVQINAECDNGNVCLK